MDSWNKLPDDLKWIVKTAAKETQLWSNAWQENLNIEAIQLFKKNVEFIRMDDETITSFAERTRDYLEGLKAKNPDVKKVLDSQEQFKKDFAEWREIRSGIVPWPLEDYISGKRTQ